ncbi:MAG: TolC family protein [Bacteroidia bacterium]|nr:TolC family protein [Bacteroidia bacterium]
MRYILLILLLFPLALPAQTFTFSLGECISRAQAESPMSTINRKSYEIAHWDYRAYKAGLKPGLMLSGQVPNFDRSITQIMQDDGNYHPVSNNRDYSSLDLAISQTIVPTGGTLTLRSGVGRSEIFGSAGQIAWNSTPMLVTFRQPIFNYNSYRWEKKLQPIRYRIAEARYLESQEDLAVDIARKFFDMYISGIELENAEFNVAVNDTVFKITEGRFNVGKIAENELLSTELALMNARSAAETARLDFREREEDLKITLGLPQEARLKLIPATTIPKPEVRVEDALKQALENRSDFLEFQSRAIRANSDLAQAKFGNRFNASLNASFGLNQSGNTLTQAYQAPLDQQSVGLGFSVPIFQWGKAQSQIKSAEAARDQEVEQIELDMRKLEKEVRYQVMRFMLLQDQVSLAAKSDTIAQRQFEVATNRYLIGKIGIIDLQTAQQQKDRARSAYIQTLKNYWVSYYGLRRATLYDFETQTPMEIWNRLD